MCSRINITVGRLLHEYLSNEHFLTRLKLQVDSGAGLEIKMSIALQELALALIVQLPDKRMGLAVCRLCPRSTAAALEYIAAVMDGAAACTSDETSRVNGLGPRTYGLDQHLDAVPLGDGHDCTVASADLLPLRHTHNKGLIARLVHLEVQRGNAVDDAELGLDARGCLVCGVKDGYKVHVAIRACDVGEGDTEALGTNRGAHCGTHHIDHHSLHGVLAARLAGAAPLIATEHRGAYRGAVALRLALRQHGHVGGELSDAASSRCPPSAVVQRERHRRLGLGHDHGHAIARRLRPVRHTGLAVLLTVHLLECHARREVLHVLAHVDPPVVDGRGHRVVGAETQGGVEVDAVLYAQKAHLE
mmetsp:Transcript_65707/g.170648  ORF Transcript_65707/g.170648 Transcript_65707/m.170648 type:complete len:360 (-) Transcript_65707:871-1950(-)